MLHIINGLSGYGKTQYILNNILENLSTNKKIIILIPEQFSFETERMFCKLQQNYKLMNMEILSFNRLSNIILREYGGLTKPVLNEVKSNVIIHLILSQVKDNLKIYKSQTNDKFFCKNILEIINIAKSNNISYYDILNLSNNMDNKLLQYKLQDISLIYKRFEEYISNKYVSSCDIINIACNKLRNNDFFNGCTIYIDSFKSFTISEYNMLNFIIAQSKDVYVTLCLDKINNESNNILHTVFDTHKKLVKISKRHNINKIKYIFLNVPYRFKNKELMLLEKNIYNVLCGNFVKCDFNWAQQNNVNIVECSNIRQEIEFLASEILNLIKDENYRFKDISIIARNVELYKLQLENIFKIYDIPYFLDERKAINDKNLIIFIISSLEAVNGNLKTLQILKLLKTGFLDVDDDEISKLEIYCNIWNINGDMWLNNFKFNPRGFSEEFTDDDKITLDDINLTRSKIVDVLQYLKEKLKQAKYGKDFIKIIYEYLINFNIQDKLLDIIKINQHEFNFYEENLKIWDCFIDILDDLADILGNDKLSLREFINFMNISISSSDIGLLPQTLDQVMVGEADRVVSANPKVVFVIGLNQGMFPLVFTQSPIFSNRENIELSNINLKLYNDKMSVSLNERYYVYKSITSSTEKVYLSYYIQSVDGKPMYKSIFISQMESMFNGLNVKKFSDSDLNLIHNDETAYSYICKNFNSNNIKLLSVKKYLEGKSNFKYNISNLDKMNTKKDFYLFNKNLLRNYLRKKLSLSPSSIERFQTCKFKFFCSDILKIKKMKKVELAPLEQGLIIHYVIKEILESSMNINLSTVEDNIKQLINKYIYKTINDEVTFNNKSNYILKSICLDVVKIINYINDEQNISDFKATNFELDISEKSQIKPFCLTLSSGEKITISGKIDRVDICNLGNVNYIRVIDYKSGLKKFDLDDIYYGLNMQMLIYLFILSNYYDNKAKTCIPAGVLYMSVKEKIPFMDRFSVFNDLNNSYEYNFKMNGILIEDIEILKLMEKELKGNFIPAKLNKDGTLSKYSSVFNLQTFKFLKDYIKNIIINISQEIFNGNINAIPISGARYKDICNYCDYRSICNLGDDITFRLLNKPPENWYCNNIKLE